MVAFRALWAEHQQDKLRGGGSNRQAPKTQVTRENRMAARLNEGLEARAELEGMGGGNSPVVMRGARILYEALIREGVDMIFGYPGGAVLHIYDELARMRGRITHVLARHEQGAVHMAEGFAKATGKPGVVLVTSGP